MESSTEITYHGSLVSKKGTANGGPIKILLGTQFFVRKILSPQQKILYAQILQTYSTNIKQMS
jgi:hypothetical protein